MAVLIKGCHAFFWMILACALLSACSSVGPDTDAPLDAAAKYQLGMQYGVDDGDRSTPVDYEQARYWLEQSAAEGHLPAMHALGWMYYEGRGATKDMPRAVGLFRTAAEQGYAESQYMLGLLYAQGWGVERDNRVSLQWIQRAAEQGHAAAKKTLSGFLAPTVE
ncbi:MAG: sel1 repeat family protein [Desulfuromonadales bacterium]|nr:sel1 repeat family protein [Desulfuromonadales bacterium]